MKSIMIQGTGSDVGKSVLVAGLCRLLTDRGLVVIGAKIRNECPLSRTAGEGPG